MNYIPTHKFNALSFRIILWIMKVHYLVKVIDTPLVAIVIFDDFWPFVIPVAHEKSISLFSGVIWHQSIRLGEGKLGWEPSPVCFWHQRRGKLRLLPPYCSHHVNTPDVEDPEISSSNFLETSWSFWPYHTVPSRHSRAKEPPAGKYGLNKRLFSSSIKPILPLWKEKFGIFVCVYVLI